VWNHLNRGDWFYPIRKWPSWLQSLMLKEHRNNRERFTLFFFLTGNGLSPDIAGEWTLLKDVGKDMVLKIGDYDNKARAQVIQMKEQLRKGTFFKGDKKMMDMHIGRVVNK
jgi:hypothetical protein